MKLAAQAGFEPATKWLTATCSTTELLSSVQGKCQRLGIGIPESSGFWEVLAIWDRVLDQWRGAW